MAQVTTTGKVLSGTTAVSGSAFLAWGVGKAVEVGGITWLNDAVSISMMSWAVGTFISPLINLGSLWIAKQTKQLSKPTMIYPEAAVDETEL